MTFFTPFFPIPKKSLSELPKQDHKHFRVDYSARPSKQKRHWTGFRRKYTLVKSVNEFSQQHMRNK